MPGLGVFTYLCTCFLSCFDCFCFVLNLLGFLTFSEFFLLFFNLFIRGVCGLEAEGEFPYFFFSFFSSAFRLFGHLFLCIIYSHHRHRYQRLYMTGRILEWIGGGKCGGNGVFNCARYFILFYFGFIIVFDLFRS